MSYILGSTIRINDGTNFTIKPVNSSIPKNTLSLLDYNPDLVSQIEPPRVDPAYNATNWKLKNPPENFYEPISFSDGRLILTNNDYKQCEDPISSSSSSSDSISTSSSSSNSSSSSSSGDSPTPTPTLTPSPTPSSSSCDASGWTYFICEDNEVIEHTNSLSDLEGRVVVAAIDTDIYNSNSIRILEFLNSSINCINSKIYSKDFGYFNCSDEVMSSPLGLPESNNLIQIVSGKFNGKCLNESGITFIMNKTLAIPIGFGASFSPHGGYICDPTKAEGRQVEYVIKPCYTGTDDDVCWGSTNGLSADIAALACALKGRVVSVNGICKVINIMDCDLADVIAQRYFSETGPHEPDDSYEFFDGQKIINMIANYTYENSVNGFIECENASSSSSSSFYTIPTNTPTPTPTTTPTMPEADPSSSSYDPNFI